MIADQPFVSFKKKEKKATKKAMDDLAEQWAKRKKESGGDGKDPLADFKGGKKTSLNEFFNNKE
jgi:hypothetical protein